MVWGRIGGGSWDRRADSSSGGVGGGATRHLLGEMPSHQKAATGGILRITVSHVLYPVTKEVLHQVLEAYDVEKMSMFERVNQVEAMVQLRSWQGAERARDALHGRCIYDRCCFLDIQLVQPTTELASTKMARRDAVASVCAPEVVVEATCSSPPDKPSASTDEPKSEPLSPPTPGCEWDDMSDEQQRRCLKMVIEVKETLYNRLGWPLSSWASSDATAPKDSTDTTAGLDGVDVVPLSQGKEQPFDVLEVVPMKTHGSSDDDQPPWVTAPTSTSVAGKDHDAAAPILVADATLVNGHLVVVDQLVVLWPHPVKCVGWSPWSPPSQVTSMSHGAEAQAMPWPSFRWDRCDEQLKQPWPPPLFLLNEVVALDCQNAQVGLIAHPLNASSSGVGVPLAFPPLDQNPSQISGAKNRTIQRCRTREMSTSCVEPTNSMVNTGTGSAAENMQEAPCLDIDVASSTLGEVKMSLKCSVDPSKFRMPSLEAVFKMVEDKCLRSHNILPPDFSIGSLMNEICQCVVQPGSDHTAEHNPQSDVGNGSSSQNESMTSNAQFVKPIACKNGGNGKYKAAEESLVLEGSENGPPNSTVAQQQPYLALSKLSTIHDVTDISKGAERVRISVVNEFGSEKCPPSFYYIPRNLVFQNAYVNISVARIGDEDCGADCYGNCLSAPIPCACARETGGEYAYTLEGLVRTAFLDECVSMNRFPEKHHRFYCKYCTLERSFEKLHLGEYEWKCYAEAFKSVCNCSSGLIRLGYQRSERVAMFAETQAEWLIALQACFRRNITFVTIYASLGEGALCHSLNETEVTTAVCGQKEIKKLIDISGQLDTVKRVIYINEEGISTEVYLAQNCTAGIRANTSSGVYREAEVYDRYIDLRAIPELNSVSKDAEGVEIGAVILISWVIEILRGEGDDCKDVAFGKIADHMEKVASHFVRNMASLGGNLIMAQRDEFASDIVMILLAAGSLVCIQVSSERLNITLEEFLEMPPCDYNTLLLSIYIPHCTPNGVSSSAGTVNTARDKTGSSLQFETYRAAPRPLGNAVSYLNSAFLAQVSSNETSGSLMLEKLCLAFGAYGLVAMVTILLYRLEVKPHSRREECHILA